MAVGAAVASVLGLTNIYLGQSQLAVGFILTLLTRDLSGVLTDRYSERKEDAVKSGARVNLTKAI